MTGAREHCGKNKMRSLIPKEVNASLQDIRPVSDPTWAGGPGAGSLELVYPMGHKHGGRRGERSFKTMGKQK